MKERAIAPDMGARARWLQQMDPSLRCLSNVFEENLAQQVGQTDEFVVNGKLRIFQTRDDEQVVDHRAEPLAGARGIVERILQIEAVAGRLSRVLEV